MKKKYETTCKQCGEKFYVDQPCKADPNNKRKFVRACSKECTRKLKSTHMKSLHQEGKLKRDKTGIQRKLDKDELIRLYCYEHRLKAEISKILKVKQQTLIREFERLEIPQVFYRTCPNCGEVYGNPIRSMVNPNSNKFKKFCSRKCFLSSRKQTDTWIEVKVREFLNEKGVEYVDQYEVDRMTVDFYVPSKRLAIEVNGDFWHANPDIYGKTKPLHRIHPRVIAKDKRKAKQLTDKDIKLLVVWENDLKTNPDKALNQIYEVIRTVS